MMKRLFTFALLWAMVCPMLAEPVENQKAAKVAETVLQDKQLTLMSMEAFQNLYVFNGAHGFVVVAADDCARPVLAYSKEFSFKTELMPGNIQNWMASLNDEIQDAVDRKLEATDETRQEWELLSRGVMPEPKHRAELQPLIKTHWDQSEPYNILCPGGSLSGCVATAMAQVMKYWDWPNKGVGSHSYDHATYGSLSANFGNTTYDWDNMFDEWNYDMTTAQVTAVSTLIYHCGVSVDMDYSPEGSSAYTDRVGEALYTYFDYYQNDMRWEYASNYDANSWIALLKRELDAERPLLYSGRGEGGGHAFICDGYDANDYLHFNWGWGGYCDGYYAYGALNPGTGGAGSGSGTYNEQNFVIAGMHPNTSSVATPTNFSASSSDRTVTLSWSPVSGATCYKVYRDGFVINTNVSNTSYSDSNVTYGDHFYYVRAVSSSGAYSLQSEKLTVAVTYPGPVVTNLTANVNDDDVHLSWTAPASENAQLKYGDGEAVASSIGSIYGTGFTWGQRFTAEQLSPYAGMAITSVDFYSWKVDSYTLFIYRESGGEMELLASKAFSLTSAGWYRVNLSTPVPFDYENNLMVVFYNDGSTYQYVAAFTEDYDGGDDNASLYLEENGCWYPIDNAISWLIRTNISDDTYSYSVYRDGQQIATNITQTNYNDSHLSDGFYQYTVRTRYYNILSDDSNVAPAVIGSNTYGISNVTVTEPTCNGGDDGMVSVSVSGGFMPLAFEFGNQSVTVLENHYTFQNVGAGTYSLRVTDNTGEALTQSVIVGEPAGLSVGSIASGTESMVLGGSCSTILSVQDATSGQVSLTYRWKQNGSVLDNSNTAQYTPKNLQPGTYTFVREVKDACTDWTPSNGTWKVLVSQNAVDESDTHRLMVYPNPTSDKVTVRCEHLASIEVVSLTGQQVATMEIDNDRAEVDLTDFHPGVYVLVVRTPNGVNHVRVIKN